MADYEPFPTGANADDAAASRTKRLLGCIGCGGLGVVGTLIALAMLVGGLGTGASGCDIDLSNDPGPGTASKRVPVAVSPRAGLHAGSTVTVESDAFAPGTSVGVAVCLREADTERRGVKACDEVQGTRYAVDRRGRLHATYPVPRTIRVGGVVEDCATKPGRCLLVAADANDYDNSGGQPLTFAGDETVPAPPPAGPRPQTDHLKAQALPAGPVAGGTVLTVVASGFQPGEPVLVARCTDQFAMVGPATCEPLDFSNAFGALAMREMPTSPVADSHGTVTIEVPAQRTIDTSLASELAGTVGTQATTTTSARPDGRFDCRTAAGRCSIVIAAAADTKRSAILPYTVAR